MEGLKRKEDRFALIGFTREVSQSVTNYASANEFCESRLSNIDLNQMSSLEVLESLGFANNQSWKRLLDSFSDMDQLRQWFLSLVTSLWEYTPLSEYTPISE